MMMHILYLPSKDHHLVHCIAPKTFFNQEGQAEFAYYL